MNRNAVNQRRYRQRANVLERARGLARTGRYADHTSIFADLESGEICPETRKRLHTIRYQLDQLCAAARVEVPAAINLAALRQNPAPVDAPARRA